MSVINELVKMPGVIVAGEYAYRGDRFSYSGQLDEEMARMASIMCRATTMATHMQVDMMQSLGTDCGCAPAQGWFVKGQNFSVCVIAHVFCFINNQETGIEPVISFMRENIDTNTSLLV
jgi:roadblock/LC7 domain-containing protein